MSISTRANPFLVYDSDYGFQQIINYGNIYDEETNAEGALCMAIAENNLCREMLTEKLNNAFQTSSKGTVLRNQGFTADVVNYTSPTGLPQFKETMRDFLMKYVWKECDITVDELVCGAGCTALLHQLARLLFEEADAVLIPTPYYPAFVHDFKNIGGVKIIDVAELTDAALTAAYEQGTRNNTPVKAMLLCNPCNPTGRIFTPEEVGLCYAFCTRHSLHLIMDEVYANSTHEAGAFTSWATSMSRHRKSNLPEAGEAIQGKASGSALGTDMVHFLWGLSKDMGGSGFRVGVLYSNNKKLLQACGGMNDMSQISNVAQQVLMTVLSDHTWVDSYFSENRAKLLVCFQTLKHGLEALGVEVYPSQSGIFAFVNLRSMFRSAACDSCSKSERNDPGGFYGQEIELEIRLRKRLLFFTPGRACHHPESGWFRICFAWTSIAGVKEALRRIALEFQGL